MTPEERQLVTGLFDRMRGFSLAQKDGDAEALISEGMQSVKDAPYMLVQSVLIQEQALQEADSRIKALEEQVRALQAGAGRPSESGSFLGGLFGSRSSAEPARAPSVPVIGSRATPSVYNSGQGWTAPPQPGVQAGQQQPAGGGFLQTAVATAAGVAGGMLAASAISNLLGGHSAHAASATAQQTQGTAGDGGGGTAQAPQQPTDTGSWQNASDDDGGWFGGAEGGDLDI
jgi:hypothetical protein